MKNKTLFEMYIRELVKNIVAEEVDRILKEHNPSTSARGISEVVESPALRPKTGTRELSTEERKSLMNKHFSVEGDTIRPTGAAVVGSHMNSQEPTVFNGRAGEVDTSSLIRNYSKELNRIGKTPD